MKKITLKSSLLSGIAALLFSLSSFTSGKLTDITKPYLGEYECKSAIFSGENLSDDFAYIILELKEDNVFSLYYEKKDGKKREEKGKYVYDQKEGTITFFVGKNKHFKRKFPLKDGELFITLQVGDNTLQMTFEQK